MTLPDGKEAGVSQSTERGCGWAQAVLVTAWVNPYTELMYLYGIFVKWIKFVLEFGRFWSYNDPLYTNVLSTYPTSSSTRNMAGSV